jgi:hypothetical protein
MLPRALRTVATATVLLCAVTATPALAQNGEPFSEPQLNGSFPGGSGSQATAATATATPEPTGTATASPSQTATSTPKPGRGRNLPNTGSDPARVGLMGLTLLGFGLSLRFRVAHADARPRD